MVTPAEKERVWALGIPGVGFRTETRRFYPNGREAAHVLGSVDIDNVGISGIEKWIDTNGLRDLRVAGVDFKKSDLTPVQLSLDLRVQHVLSNELAKAVAKFDAIAAAGMVLDVRNGEVLALVSLPDFDPNIAEDALKPDRINRVNVGVYEMGSTFKALTTAMALDSGVYKIDSVLDASQPLRFGRFTINDYRGQGRPLTVPESFIYSSNIAMARMALGIGAAAQQNFLKAVGQLDRLTTELPESAQPLVPRNWTEVSTATVAFGHGIAVAPIQATMAIAAMVNGGNLVRPTFIKGKDIEARTLARAVISPQTSEAIRFLMRLNAEIGSAAKADIPAYFVGGKTGTSNKVVNGRYSDDKVRNAFMGVAPADDARYLFLTLLDEPKGLPETSGFRTSGWNAVPVTGAIMARVLPMLGITPRNQPPPNPFPTMVRLNAWGSERFRAPEPEQGTIPDTAPRRLNSG
jgi:cell division protein FtsI (penicillin-binding protein 3)